MASEYRAQPVQDASPRPRALRQCRSLESGQRPTSRPDGEAGPRTAPECARAYMRSGSAGPALRAAERSSAVLQSDAHRRYGPAPAAIQSCTMACRQLESGTGKNSERGICSPAQGFAVVNLM